MEAPPVPQPASVPPSRPGTVGRGLHWLARLGRAVRGSPRRALGVVCWLLVIGGAGWLWLVPWLLAEYHWRQARQALAASDFSLARAQLGACFKSRPGSAAVHF